MSAFNNATLMITGGTGSFGSTVMRSAMLQILESEAM